MGRISKQFTKLDNETALVGFITAGDPTLEHTVTAMHGLVAGGTDIIELGMPFSDPEAEGPAIQASSERALANGVTLSIVLEMVAQFRQSNTETPIVLMGYLNAILAHDDFAGRAQTAGVDGLIMVNLPPEESTDLKQDLATHDIDLVFLIAPTTVPERVTYILNQSSGFVYYVALKGITGADHLDTDEVATNLSRIRNQTDLPVCVGFGIKDEVAARALGAHADGVVVGSALVNVLAETGNSPDEAASALRDFCKTLGRGAKQQ
jgi:tryptophan synthase alpha chain